MRVAGRWQAAVLAGLVLGGTAAPGRACRGPWHEPSPLREGGAEVGMAILVEFYKELPRRQGGEKAEAWAERLQQGLNGFKKKVAGRYTEGTLQRLLDCPKALTRRAAVVALGLTGTPDSTPPVAAMLHDNDAKVRQLAVDALWLLWFRADKPANNKELQRLRKLAGEPDGDPGAVLAGLGGLIRKAPRFAEAYNQRAILHYRAGRYEEAIADCRTVLKLNPFHFGAASGLAHAYMKIKKPKAALKAFRNAYRINPGMQEVGEAIRFLENVLGEEGKR